MAASTHTTPSALMLSEKLFTYFSFHLPAAASLVTRSPVSVEVVILHPVENASAPPFTLRMRSVPFKIFSIFLLLFIRYY